MTTTPRGLVLLIPLVGLLTGLLSGCFSQSRSEITTTDRVTFQVQVPVSTPEGVKLVPVSGSLRRTGSQQEITHAGPDTDAITQAVTQGLAALVPAVGGAVFPWANALGGAGAVLTAATTGYLALKKREQMKPTSSRKEV